VSAVNTDGPDPASHGAPPPGATEPDGAIGSAAVPAAEPEGGANTARNSATVAIWTLLSRATGLIRVVIIGAVLGATYFTNSFQTAVIVPNIVFSLVAGPVLTMVVVPGLIGAMEKGGTQRAREVFTRVMGWLLVLALGVVVILLLAAPLLAWTLSFAIPDPVERARGLRMTTLLLWLVIPQLPIYCLAHLGVAAQRARGKFALSAAAPAMENIGLIVAVVIAGCLWGSGIPMGRVPVAMVVLLGLGSTGAVGLHAALQLFGTARVGLLGWPSPRWRRDPEAREVTRLLRRSVGVASLPGLSMYVLLALAGSVPGGAWVVQMSYSVLYALSYLSSRAVGMASLPELAEAVRRHDAAGFGVVWRRGLAYALIAGVPLLVMLGILGGPTANILADGAMHDSALLAPMGVCLTLVAVAQLITGLSDLGNQALYSRSEDRVPRLASRVTLVVTVVLAAASLLGPTGGVRLAWLVAAILAGELVSTALVLGRIGHAIRPERFVDRSALRATLAGALAMVPFSVLTWWVQHRFASGQLGTLAVLCVGGALAVAAYGLVLRTLWRRSPSAS
jgi:putative peptidoglycan lipid II flippase